MLEFRYDTQLLIDGENLDEDVISEYFAADFRGRSGYMDGRTWIVIKANL